jgi:dihydroxyacetone kinase
LICDQNDPERGFVKFNKGDDTVLLINNYGGLSNLELGALNEEALSQLGKYETKKGSGKSVNLSRQDLGYQAYQNILWYI